METYKNLTFQK